MRLAGAIGLSLSALLAATSQAGAEEREYLRLRPLKQPTACVGNAKGNCPLVAAPRINRRLSTIPGVAHPDFGRPQVMILPPPSPRVVAPYRSYGGNRGITGGM
jgi:hypothetical protein